ncbi:MAG: hypothetical protein AAF639_14075 [Chloroflexota bacterium]
MNKLMKFGLAAVTVATAGILTISSISYAQDTVQGGNDSAGAPGLIERGQRFFQQVGERGQRGFRGGERGERGPSWLTREEKAEIAAGVLGMTVEELEAAKESGTSMAELLETAGLTKEEFKAAMQPGLIAEVNEAVADGDLTQEQADVIIERIESGEFGHGRHGKRGHRGGPAFLERGEHKEIVAGVLGMTVEELETAKEADTSMAELIESAGLTEEEFKAAMQTAVIEAVNQAVADGEITQEQADRIIERIESGDGFGRGGRGDGEGQGEGRSRRGGPGRGFGPGQDGGEAPARGFAPAPQNSDA